MDHQLLIEEMKLTAKLPVMERIYLAKKRRFRQLENFKKWDQRDGDITECEEYIRKPKIQFSLEVRLFEAITSGNLQEFSTLLEEEIDPNIRNYEGLTPLHQSCIDGYYEMVYLLLQRGAEVNATDMDGWTPLHAAATCGHKNIVKLLVQNGADLLASNTDEDMPFEITEDEEVLNFLQREMIYQGITAQMLNEKRHTTYSILHKDILKVLNAKGNLDSPVTDDGASFLHIATGHFYNDLVELLLQKGASPNKADNDGWNPIHVAAYWGNEEAFKLLIKEYKAGIEVQTYAGETPYDLCDNQDIKIYIKGLLRRKSSLQSSNLNIDYFELDFLDIHYIMEEQSKTSSKNENLLEEKPPKFRRRSFDEILPILPPLFNPKANELASDKRTSFREAKKFAPNIKTLSSERLKDGLADETIANDIEEINESTTKFTNNEIESPKSDNTICNVDNSASYETASTPEPEFKEHSTEEHKGEHNESEVIYNNNNNNNTNNNNIKSEESMSENTTNISLHDIKQNNKLDIHNSKLPNQVSQTSLDSLPQNTLSSLKRYRIEQRQQSITTKRFSEIDRKSEQGTINRSNPNTPDIMHIFRQTELQYNHPSIVKENKCCKIM